MNNTKISPGHIRLPHGVIVRAPGLLPMLYRVSELAEEIGILDSTLRGWLGFGAPHQRDGGGHLWIHGASFAAWILEQRKPKRENRLANDEAFCMHCRRVTRMVNPVIKPIKGKLIHIIGACTDCGCTIQRGGRCAGSG